METQLAPSLSVSDPLAGQAVTVVISLAPGDQLRDERPVPVTVGVAGQAPVLRSGVFGQAAGLIDDAWTAFGLRRQLGTAQADGQAEAGAGETEMIAEAAVEAQARPPAALPRPQNLSLF